MASKLAPADPTSSMVIRQITPNITTLSLPFARFGRARIGGRATLVRLASGRVAVFSPVALTPAARAAADALGPVGYIAALDLEHHLFLRDWHAAWPDARVVAPAGLAEKRKAQGEAGVRFDVHVKPPTTPGPAAAGREDVVVDDEFDGEFDIEFVHGHANKELVFNFRRERTLVQADLIFNLPALEQYSRSDESPHAGWATRLFNAIQGTSGSALAWQRRFIWYIGGAQRGAFADSVRRIYAWDFDRMIPCHGDVVETGAKGVFKSVMQWYLKGE